MGLTSADSLPVGILFVNIFMILVTTLTVGLRFWSRSLKGQSWEASDWTIIIAWILFMGVEISMNISLVDGGVGQAMDQLTLEEEMTQVKSFFAVTLLGTPTVCFSKISACELFKKIFPSRTFHIYANILIALLYGYFVSVTITSLASCQPFELHFNPMLPGHCIDNSTYFTSVTSIGVVFDFLVVLLPLPVVWQLQMNLRKKITLTILFSLALIICGISIGRATVNANATLLETDPATWDALTIVLATIEAGLSIIVACAPLMQPVATGVGNTLRSLLSRSGGSSSNLSDPESNVTGLKKKRSMPFAGSQNAQFRRLQDHLFPDVSKGDTMVTVQDKNGGGTQMSNAGEKEQNVELRQLSASSRGTDVTAAETQASQEIYGNMKA